jgi:hypothetical protein
LPGGVNLLHPSGTFSKEIAMKLFDYMPLLWCVAATALGCYNGWKKDGIFPVIFLLFLLCYCGGFGFGILLRKQTGVVNHEQVQSTDRSV